MRILSIKAIPLPQPQSWTIIALCADGKSRVQRGYMQHNKPELSHAQYSLDTWPSLWEVLP